MLDGGIGIVGKVEDGGIVVSGIRGEEEQWDSKGGDVSE